MKLRGQGGYAMAALLVAIAVMAIMMSAAMPVWRHEAQREKEDELVFRGTQYIRAIRLYQAKTKTLPPNIDALVQGHFIRKKFKDPITDDDFLAIPAAGGIPGQGGQVLGPNGQPMPGSSPVTAGQQTAINTASQSAFSSSTSASVPGGMSGVVSKSKDESIRLYNGRNHYNEWYFIFVNATPGGANGRGVPGGANGRGTPGQPGGPGTGNGRGGNGRGGDGRGNFPGRGFNPGEGQQPFPFPGRGRGGL